MKINTMYYDDSQNHQVNLKVNYAVWIYNSQQTWRKFVFSYV